MLNNTRSSGQKLISVPMNEKFIVQIDLSLPKIGYSDRSSFIRDAIVEKFHKSKINIPVELSLSPSRAGKGGRPPLAKNRVVAKRGRTALVSRKK